MRKRVRVCLSATDSWRPRPCQAPLDQRPLLVDQGAVLLNEVGFTTDGVAKHFVVVCIQRGFASRMQLFEPGAKGMEAFHQALELRMLHVVHARGCSRRRFGSSLRH